MLTYFLSPHNIVIYLKVISQAMANKWRNGILLFSRPIAEDFNDFGWSSFETNAWYQRERNAFSLAIGFLQPPFYRPDYPPAMIYGIIGAVIGHEITHGFDISGVSWTEQGREESWMTEESQEGFKNGSECLVDQYNNFCYNITAMFDGGDDDEEDDSYLSSTSGYVTINIER